MFESKNIICFGNTTRMNCYVKSRAILLFMSSGTNQIQNRIKLAKPNAGMIRRPKLTGAAPEVLMPKNDKCWNTLNNEYIAGAYKSA